MPIDYSRLRSLTGRQIENSLLRDGFQFVRQRGSHRRFRDGETGRVVTVAVRGGDAFKTPTLRTIIETQAHWNRADLVRLGLIRD